MVFDRKKYHKAYYKKNQDKLRAEQRNRYHNRDAKISDIKFVAKRGNFIISFD
tara:strand:- start:565 stop:723 length:159 start_codon:yes stop_codon:yes gene_type:complete